MTIMTICELGKEWEDPTKIPVDEIVTEWREQSSKGRYEVAMWRGLEEPNAKGAKGAKEGADADAEMEVDNLAAGGFFGWMDVISSGPRERVRAGAYPPPAAHRALEARVEREMESVLSR